MKFSDMFPSNFLKASDLDGKEVSLKIATISMEKMSADSDEKKPVAYFHRLDGSTVEKALVLNKTNGSVLCEAFGEDTDNWVGQNIVLYSAPVVYQGKMVQGVRIRVPGGATVADEEPPF